MKVRLLNALLGMWLLVSAFMWPHSLAQFHNAWAVGLLVTAFAVASILGSAWARYANFALALWLFFSTAGLPRESMWTAFNHVLVAAGLIVTSLFPEHPRHVAPREAARGAT